MMMWSRFIRILSEMQKGSKYFLNHPSIHPNKGMRWRSNSVKSIRDTEQETLTQH